MAIAIGHKVEITRGPLEGRRGNILSHTANRAELRLETGEYVDDVPHDALRCVRGRPFRTAPECTGVLAFGGGA